MKACSKILIFISVLFLLASCGHQVEVETVVHPDGSLDRSITLMLEDSVAIERNFFGVNESKGWKASIRKLSDDEINRIKKENESNKGDFIIEFTKSFPSVDEANAEMNSDSDTLFHVKSGFEKKFRWFYTYVRYSDTYGAANRFRHVSPEDFFTPEDHSFIRRLPSDTRFIPAADSLYLKWLNSKIEDDFARKGYYEEYYHAFIESLQQNNVQQQWIDTLHKYKKAIYDYTLLEEKKKSDKELDVDFLFRVADTLHIPLPYKQTHDDFKSRIEKIEPRTEFMNHVTNGKYVHAIQMPWPVVDTNADSVAGNKVFWKPHYLKFAFNDHTMYAESRTINYIPVTISAVLIGLSAVIVLKRRKKKYPV